MKNLLNKTRLGTLLTLGAALTLVSCNQRSSEVVTVMNCPAVGAVAHMTTLTKFSGLAKTNNQVIFDAYLNNLDYECNDQDSVNTTISFTINAKRGPAMQSDVQTIRYFVVVVRDNYLVTAKQTYTTQIRWAPGQETAGVRETILQQFDNAQTLRRYDYEVLVGFELEPDELQFNVVR